MGIFWLGSGGEGPRDGGRRACTRGLPALRAHARLAGSVIGGCQKLGLRGHAMLGSGVSRSSLLRPGHGRTTFFFGRTPSSIGVVPHFDDKRIEEGRARMLLPWLTANFGVSKRVVATSTVTPRARSSGRSSRTQAHEKEACTGTRGCVGARWPPPLCVHKQDKRSEHGQHD